jgi:carboxylesterase type B
VLSFNGLITLLGGTGNDAGSDGGNLASREDIVVVNINYRLSTLGFFAVPGTNITGNYGIGDQVNALKVSPQPSLCNGPV